MKRVFLVFLCLVLCSCAVRGDLKSELDAVFSTAGTEEKIRHNNFTEYVDYYLPSDVSEETADRLSCILTYNRSRIIMDINISGIINERYYDELPLEVEGFFDESRAFYRKEGTYKDDQRDGKFVEKDRNGRVIASGTYTRGHRQLDN